MSNLEFNRANHAAGATFCVLLLLLGLTAQPAAANSEYNSASLNGNLQNQCTAFSATRVQGSSLTVSAECNKQGDTAGSVAAARRSTSLNLRGEVDWNSTTQTFEWDPTSSADTSDISAKCVAVRGFSYSSTDVTLQLTCTVIDATGGGLSTRVNADLPLNAKVTVGTDGNLARR